MLISIHLVQYHWERIDEGRKLILPVNRSLTFLTYYSQKGLRSMFPKDVNGVAKRPGAGCLAYEQEWCPQATQARLLLSF